MRDTELKEAVPKDLQMFLKSNKVALKDKDFLFLSSHFGRIYRVNLPKVVIQRLNTAIENDSGFLKKLNLMDYSLLLGIEEVGEDYLIPRSERSMMSECGKFKYHLKIIDYLQLFTF